jgi:glycosyltransferase involved in cell wall biosynthesis
LPEVVFAFVGPVDPWVDFGALKRLPNVRFLGRKEYREVPAYVAACRVCWIPFAGGRIVQNTNPIKLYEYFALGKPVVSTPMPEVESYRQEGLVYIGGSPRELVTAIRQGLSEGESPAAQRRIEVAREHDWETLIGRLYEVLRTSAGDDAAGGIP